MHLSNTIKKVTHLENKNGKNKLKWEKYPFFIFLKFFKWTLKLYQIMLFFSEYKHITKKVLLTSLYDSSMYKFLSRVIEIKRNLIIK